MGGRCKNGVVRKKILKKRRFDPFEKHLDININEYHCKTGHSNEAYLRRKAASVRIKKHYFRKQCHV